MARGRRPPAEAADEEKPPQREHRPHQLGPRIEQRGASPFWKADLRPWGGSRYTPVRDPSHPLWPAAGDETADEDVARKWAWEYVHAYLDERRRRHLGQGRILKLETAQREWLRHRKATVSANTYSSSVTAVRHLVEHMGGQASTGDVDVLVLQSLADDLSERGYAATTLKTYFNGLSAFCAWVGFGDRNPARRVVLPDPGEEDPRAWDDDEMAEIRKAADAVDRKRRFKEPSARFAVETGWGIGPRQQELFALEWPRIDPRSESIRITRQLVKDGHGFAKLKGKRARTTFVLPFWWEWYRPDALGLLVCNRDGSVISARARIQTQLIQSTLDRAGLNAPGLGWHTLRHTYARLCLERYDVRMEELQLFLGHESITVTQRIYGHFREHVAVAGARRRARAVEGDAGPGLRVLPAG